MSSQEAGTPRPAAGILPTRTHKHILTQHTVRVVRCRFRAARPTRSEGLAGPITPVPSLALAVFRVRADLSWPGVSRLTKVGARDMCASLAAFQSYPMQIHPGVSVLFGVRQGHGAGAENAGEGRQPLGSRQTTLRSNGLAVPSKPDSGTSFHNRWTWSDKGEGAVLLASALGSQSHLTDLNLRGAGLEDEGVTAIVKVRKQITGTTTTASTWVDQSD